MARIIDNVEGDLIAPHGSPGNDRDLASTPGDMLPCHLHLRHRGNQNLLLTDT